VGLAARHTSNLTAPLTLAIAKLLKPYAYGKELRAIVLVVIHAFPLAIRVQECREHSSNSASKALHARRIDSIHAPCHSLYTPDTLVCMVRLSFPRASKLHIERMGECRIWQQKAMRLGSFDSRKVEQRTTRAVAPDMPRRIIDVLAPHGIIGQNSNADDLAQAAPLWIAAWCRTRLGDDVASHGNGTSGYAP